MISFRVIGWDLRRRSASVRYRPSDAQHGAISSMRSAETGTSSVCPVSKKANGREPVPLFAGPSVSKRPERSSCCTRIETADLLLRCSCGLRARAEVPGAVLGRPRNIRSPALDGWSGARNIAERTQSGRERRITQLLRDAPRLSIGEAFLRRADLFDRFGLRAPGLVELIDGANGAGVELRLKKARHFWNGGET